MPPSTAGAASLSASCRPRQIVIIAVAVVVGLCIFFIVQSPSIPTVTNDTFKDVIKNLGTLEEDKEIRDGSYKVPSTKPVGDDRGRNAKGTNSNELPPVPSSRGAGREKSRSDASTSKDNNIKNNKIAPVLTSLPTTYTSHVHAILLEELGVELATALYDPYFLSNAMRFIDGAPSTATSAATLIKEAHIDPNCLFLTEKGLEWAFRTVLFAPSVPAPMATVPTRLVLLKQVTSLAIGRLARDGRLAEGWLMGDGFNSRPGTNQSRLAYDRPLRSAIRGFASYAISYLQVLLDGEKRMPDLAEWARTANNKYNGMVNKEGHVDVKDPIIYPHLDPLIVLLQVMRAGPATTSEPLTDPSVVALLKQAGRLRAAAEPLLCKALGTESSTGVNNEKVIATVLDSYILQMQKASTGVVFRGILDTYEQTKGSQKQSTASAALIDTIGYATMVWNNRIEVIDAALSHQKDTPPSKKDYPPPSKRGPSLAASRAQYALQYFANSDYNKWNVHLRNGRFWNSIRPVVGCSALSKLCEEPDGCRYLCNLNYLLLGEPRLPSSSSSSSSLSDAAGKRYAHQAVGFGSNNEYDWELGLVDAFKRGAAVVGGHHPQQADSNEDIAFLLPNTIGRITVFDCTLKKWTPPSFLSEGHVGFGHASYCLGLKDVSPLPTVRIASGDGKDGVAVVGFPSIRKFINSDGLYPGNYFEKEAGADQDTTLKRPANPFLKRYTVFDNIVKNPDTAIVHHHEGSGPGDFSDDVIVPSPLYVDYKTFDEVSIIKFDVEGFEHSSFPSFLRAELEDLHAHYAPKLSKLAESSKTPFPIIFFDSEAPDSLTIGQLGMEFHRQGHKGPSGSTYAGAMRAHYTLMQLYSKGFLMFAQEKNPVDYCCYEIALTHYRHYIRSEVWQSL